ncbi:hypothetical protein Tco_0501171, partial [Tanacetum coccineum]
AVEAHKRDTTKNMGSWNHVAQDFKGTLVTDIQKKDKNEAKIDKTEHENGKSVEKSKSRSKSKAKSQSQKVKTNPKKS